MVAKARHMRSDARRAVGTRPHRRGRGPVPPARRRTSHPRSAFATATLRSIRGSLGRFLAILGIVALGCGFFAGLVMSGPDMRDAADRWYRGTNLWDLRVISTLGFSDDDVDRVGQVDGIEAVMPSRTVDAMATLGSEQGVVRVQSLDTDAAAASAVEGDYAVASEDDDYLNRVQLREGRLPQAAGECVALADAPTTQLAVGTTVGLTRGTTDLDQLLRTTTLTVVGTVSSSNYPYTANFGSTTLGTGEVDQVLLVGPESFVDDAPYTEVYATVEGATDAQSESDAYWDVIDPVRRRVERAEEPLAEARQDDLKAQAQAELDQRKADYEAQKAEAESQLDDAKAQLDSSKAQLDSGEQQYDTGLAQYESGASQYESGQAAYDAGLARYQEAEREYQAGVDALVSGVGAGLDGVIASAQALSTSVQATADAYTAAGVTEESIASLREVVRQLEPITRLGPLEDVEDIPDRAATVIGSLTGARTALALWTPPDLSALPDPPTPLDVSQTLGTLDGLLSQARSRLSEATSGVSQLASARWQLEDARIQLAVAQAQLGSAAQETASGKAQLDATRAQLDQGWQEYNDGLAQYEEGRKEADERFADAERQLDEAQARIDSISEPDIYVLDRSQSEGAATYHADTERMDHIASVFPLMFFLVAALVSLTTMTRMVDDERVEIGTYKALGYSTGRIASKYLVYAGVASGTGALLGIALLSQVLPYIVISSYAIIYAVPMLPFPLPVAPTTALAAGGVGVGITLVATWAAVVSSLRETPALLMLPRAPKAGKRILLERIRPLWAHISFSWKVTCRNLFRYKRRLLMTVIGISGCTALLLVGFGLHDSIWDIIDKQFGPIVHYNTTIGLDDDAGELAVGAVTDYLEASEGVSEVVRVQQENMQAGAEGHDGTTRVSVVVPRSADELSGEISFRERLSQRPVRMDDNAVLVTEKLASLLGLSPGSSVTLFDQDGVGNAYGEGHVLTVTGVVENYVGNLVYVGRNAWRSVSGTEPAFSTVYAQVDGGADAHQAMARALHDMDGVTTVTFADETVQTYRTMLTVVDGIVVVLIVCAGLLAFIVLYNLTNINVEERVREIASLKVLGFTRHEVHAYVFREILILAFLGDVVGMVLGTWLETFTITAAEVDYVMFGREIHPLSYLYAFAITMAFAVAIVLLMRGKLDRVSMVESLKSVD